MPTSESLIVGDCRPFYFCIGRFDTEARQEECRGEKSAVSDDRTVISVLVDVKFRSS